MSSTLNGHGSVGRRDSRFTELKGRRIASYDMHKLAILAQAMSLHEREGANDGPDSEENLYVPAGYTYLGQFIDHDLTFDSTSSLDPSLDAEPGNGRTPRFDLDCLYGNGPDDQPYMYEDDGVRLLTGGPYPKTRNGPTADLPRAKNHRAIIGDKRNDENSIINQIQQAFIRFHNLMVDKLAKEQALSGRALFEAARNEVRWTYQRIALEDFLPRVVAASVLEPFKAAWKLDPYTAYLWYTADKRSNLPREFVAAAYRFGHSGVRTGYRMRGTPGKDRHDRRGFRANIFQEDKGPHESLIGFDPLPGNHVIDDWARFFPLGAPMPGQAAVSNMGTSASYEDGGDGTLRLQYAYKIDPTLVDPLARLPKKIATADEVPETVGNRPKRPSLALLNLLRGNSYRIQGGQSFARDLPPADRLPPEFLCVRKRTRNGFTFKPISELADPDHNRIGNEFDSDTPLWFYILAEAQRPLVQLWLDRRKHDLTENDLLGRTPDGQAMEGNGPALGAGTQLGPVGGRMVTEVFYGLLESDAESVLRAAPYGWTPAWGGPATMGQLLKFIGLPIQELPIPA